MKPTYVVIVTALGLAFSTASAESTQEPSNNWHGATTNSEGLRFKVGEPFFAARKRILQAGWQPMQTHRDYEYIGIEKELIDRKFFEVSYCSMDAGSLCVLYYRKEARCLRLGTVGEQMKFMRVTYWSAECPEDN
jgi:hypothetical protein